MAIWLSCLLFAIIMIGLIVFTLIGLYRVYYFRQYYPVCDLSPYLTLTQGLSLQIFSINLAQFLFRFSIKQITTVKYYDWDVVLTSNLFLWSRGLFFVTTFIKSYRLLLTCQQKLYPLQIYLFSDEKFLVLISLLISYLLWPTATYISTHVMGYKMNDVLIVFENLNYYRYTINTIEEGCIFYLIFKMRKQSPVHQMIMSSLFRPLMIYFIWFILNSCLDSPTQSQNTELDNSLFILWGSCFIRAQVMFYLYLIHPTLKVNLPLPHIPSYIAMKFKYFFQIPFNVRVFNKFVIYLDKKYKTKHQFLFLTWLKMNLMGNFESVQKSSSTLSMIKEALEEDKSINTDHLNSVNFRMEQLFEIYLKTQSSFQLEQYHINSELVNQNMFTLKIRENLYAPTQDL
ncbi:hypothetical protein pb186bvf_002561 [Paramecium bursaria]